MKSWTILLSTLCLFSCNQQENKFEKYVDPLIGTDIRIVQGKDKNSTEERGQIMPAVGVPHGRYPIVRSRNSRFRGPSS
jgi:hypothetical protein